MSKKRFTTEQIIHKLRQAEVEIAKGKRIPAQTPRPHGTARSTSKSTSKSTLRH